MPRLLLIANPFASGVTERRLAEVQAALAAAGDVETRLTSARGHATGIAADATGYDAVVVFSGDGGYNEVLNGLVGRGPIGFVPGGGTSVLPRALGLPRDAVAAAERVAGAIAEARTRRVSLGRANGRRFSFSAGIGLDAEAVRRMEARGRREDGRRPGDLTFAWTVARMLVSQRLAFPTRLEIAGAGRAALVFVANCDPYTYAGPAPLRIVRGAEFEAGLDFVAPVEVDAASALPLVLRGLRGTLHESDAALHGHDLDRIEVVCDEPMPLQVDGEDIGDVTSVLFEAERDALDVLA